MESFAMSSHSIAYRTDETSFNDFATAAAVVFPTTVRAKVVKQAAILVALTLSMISSAATVARELPADPLNSVMWESMANRFMPDGEIIFDDRVKVMAPFSAENQFHVPVTVDATALEDVQEIVVVADLNPIPLVMNMRPRKALSYIGLRLKLQQTSPIHVGVRTGDGVWRVGYAVVDAAGGGCTAPAAAHGNSNWMRTLGETRALASRSDADTARMTLRMRHPMDTGLAAGIPAFYMNELEVKNNAGEIVAQLDLFEPVSENPTFTLRPRVGNEAETLHVSTRDTEGNTFNFPLSIPAFADL